MGLTWFNRLQIIGIVVALMAARAAGKATERLRAKREARREREKSPRAPSSLNRGPGTRSMRIRSFERMSLLPARKRPCRAR